ncbi:MAG: amidohydrolase family protein [Bacteroidota bacterium]
MLTLLLSLTCAILLGQSTLLIHNVHVIPMTSDTIWRNQMILIQDGRIHEIGPHLHHSDLSSFDAKGQYLMPGLIDMHVHLQDKKELGLYLANGVTSIRNLQGLPWHLKIRKKIQNGNLSGPQLLTSSPQLSGPQEDDPTRIKLKSPKQAEKMVRKYKKQGYDCLKTYNKIPEEIFNALVRTAREENIPVVAHPSFYIPYENHFQDGVVTIEHTEDIVQQALDHHLDSVKLSTVITGFARHGMTHCPTLSVYSRIDQILTEGASILTSDELAYLNHFFQQRSKKEFKGWTAYAQKKPEIKTQIATQQQFHLYILGQMYKAGIPIVCGTDAGILFNPAGFSMHDELAFYREAGMSSFEALKTATINPSGVHPELADLGSIEPGKKANLLLLADNPLKHPSTLRNPRFVMVEGKMIEREELTEMKEKAYQHGSGFGTFMRFGWFILTK